jgi:hypothetical protein
VSPAVAFRPRCSSSASASSARMILAAAAATTQSSPDRTALAAAMAIEAINKDHVSLSSVNLSSSPRFSTPASRLRRLSSNKLKDSVSYTSGCGVHLDVRPYAVMGGRSGANSPNRPATLSRSESRTRDAARSQSNMYRDTDPEEMAAGSPITTAAVVGAVAAAGGGGRGGKEGETDTDTSRVNAVTAAAYSSTESLRQSLSPDGAQGASKGRNTIATAAAADRGRNANNGNKVNFNAGTMIRKAGAWRSTVDPKTGREYYYNKYVQYIHTLN